MSNGSKRTGTIKVIKREDRARVREITKATATKKQEPSDVAREVNTTIEGWVREFKHERKANAIASLSHLPGMRSERGMAA